MKIINKKTTNKITSKINIICKLILAKDNILGLTNTKNVSIHKDIQTIESNIIKRKSLSLFNI